jgi:hypothetical protein
MTPRRALRCLSITTFLACLWATLGTMPAPAAPVTVGQSSGEPDFECNSTTGNGTLLQSTAGVAGEEDLYKIPFDGVITSWSFHAGAKLLANLKFKGGHVTEAGRFRITAEADAGAQTVGQATSFPVSVPVKENDLIGIYPGGSGTCVVQTGKAADVAIGAAGDIAPGSEALFISTSQARLPVSATVQPVPAISSLTPAGGDPAGGTKVTISGADFTGASAVSFGATPAAAFTVNSETQVTAFTPAAAAGTVDVRVTTPAGQSLVGAADRFTFATPAPILSGSSFPGLSSPAFRATGKRAAALKKCGKKKSAKARRRCRKKAKKLPL